MPGRALRTRGATAELTNNYYIYADLSDELPSNTDLGSDGEDWEILYEDGLTSDQRHCWDLLFAVLKRLSGANPVPLDEPMINSAVKIAFYGENGPGEPWILGARFQSPRGFWAISATPAQPDYWGRHIQIIVPAQQSS